MTATGALTFSDEAVETCLSTLGRFVGQTVDVTEVNGDKYTATLVSVDEVEGDAMVSLDVWKSGDDETIVNTVDLKWYDEVKEMRVC